MTSPAVRSYAAVRPPRLAKLEHGASTAAGYAPNWPLLAAIIGCVAFWAVVAILVASLALG